MASRHVILFSETIRCLRQQRVALLLLLLLNFLNYCLYTRGSWIAPVPTVGSLKMVFSRMVIGNLLGYLLITTPWLLLTHVTLQQQAISLPQLIRRSMRLFPKLIALHVMTILLTLLLVLITVTTIATILLLLLWITGTISAISDVIAPEFIVRLLTSSPPWLCSTLPLLLMLSSYYMLCRLLFTTYIAVTDPQATLLSTLRLSWRWSRSCLSNLLVASLLLGLLTFIPTLGLQFTSLRTCHWVNLGLTLYSNALGFVSSIYFFVLYQQQSALREHASNLSGR